MIFRKKAIQGRASGQSRDEAMQEAVKIGIAETAARAAEQLKIVELSDVVRALAQVPVPQREALILVGAGGFSYEEAATIMGTAIGTVKSRVARARTALEALINDGQLARSRSEFEADENVTNLFSVIDAIEDRQSAREPGEAMIRLVA